MDRTKFVWLKWFINLSKSLNLDMIIAIITTSFTTSFTTHFTTNFNTKWFCKIDCSFLKKLEDLNALIAHSLRSFIK